MGLKFKAKKCEFPAQISKIYGWIFDLVNQTISLPQKKVEKLLRKAAALFDERWRINLKDLQKYTGNVCWASLGFPTLRALSNPLIKAKILAHQHSPGIENERDMFFILRNDVVVANELRHALKHIRKIVCETNCVVDID